MLVKVKYPVPVVFDLSDNIKVIINGQMAELKPSFVAIEGFIRWVKSTYTPWQQYVIEVAEKLNVTVKFDGDTLVDVDPRLHDALTLKFNDRVKLIEDLFDVRFKIGARLVGRVTYVGDQVSVRFGGSQMWIEVRVPFNHLRKCN